MIKVTNYTANYEIEFETLEELEVYVDDRDVTEHEEINYLVVEVGLSGLENCQDWFNLSEDKQEQVIAVAERAGIGYFKTIEDLQTEYEDSIWCTATANNDYELARHFMYDTNSDMEILYSILGCTAEAYEQLNSFISCDDLELVMRDEVAVQYVNGTAYLFIS